MIKMGGYVTHKNCEEVVLQKTFTTAQNQAMHYKINATKIEMKPVQKQPRCYKGAAFTISSLFLQFGCFSSIFSTVLIVF